MFGLMKLSPLFYRSSKVNLNICFKLSQLVTLNKAAVFPEVQPVLLDRNESAKQIVMKTPSEIVQSARIAFETGRTKSLDFREQQLKNLLRMYEENEQEILAALKKDLNKNPFEGILTEVMSNIKDVKETIENFREWAKPEKAEKDLPSILDEALIYKDPYGVVLVIGAWNYPIILTLSPVTGAIAAGNTVVIKPSEVAPASAEFIAKTIPKYLDNECYQVMCGGVPETTQLLGEKFDYIFFTGSTSVGRVVHAAANKYLTPVTLELGGKSPVYIDNSADVDVATKRILWGKCMNAGQTCIAPDYILCSKDVEVKFINKAKEVLKEWYGDDPQKSSDFSRIVSKNHAIRISKFLNNGKIVIGGKTDLHDKYIEPTVLIDVQPSDPVMQEEIFGPVLPILTANSAHDAVKFINERPKPLALYVFSQERSSINTLLDNTSSGGVCVNDTIMHLTLPSLPFGGVGPSGMGAYHGKYTFDTFVHKKSALIKNLSRFGEKLQSARYPPYTEKNINFLRKAMVSNSNWIRSFKYFPYVLIFGLGLLTSFMTRYITDKNRYNTL